MMNNFMNGMFGKIGSGMCKLSMSGNIAVKTLDYIRAHSDFVTVHVSSFME